MSFNIKSQYKYHILYEIKNKINGKKYIGIHSTNNINDNYFGSGVYIKRAIDKYGLENFTKKVLKQFKTRKELLQAEKEIVTESIVGSGDYYNVCLGGSSFVDSLINLDEKEFREHQVKAGKKGGKSFYENLTEEQRKEWHRKGRAASSGTKGKKINIKDAEKYSESRKVGASKRKRYDCPICDKKNLDGGNFKQHLIRKHNFTEEEYLKIK